MLFQMVDALLKRNIFVMIANLRLGGRGIDRLRKLVGFLQPLRQLDAADGSVFLVACPSASGDISAHNTFNGKHVQFAAHHRFAFKFFLLEKFRHILYVYRNHVIGNNILRHIEPEFRHLCEHSSFFGNFVVQNHVETADAVGSYHDQAVAVVVNLTYFTFFDRF